MHTQQDLFEEIIMHASHAANEIDTMYDDNLDGENGITRYRRAIEHLSDADALRKEFDEHPDLTARIVSAEAEIISYVADGMILKNKPLDTNTYGISEFISTRVALAGLPQPSAQKGLSKNSVDPETFLKNLKSCLEDLNAHGKTLQAHALSILDLKIPDATRAKVSAISALNDLRNYFSEQIMDEDHAMTRSEIGILMAMGQKYAQESLGTKISPAVVKGALRQAYIDKFEPSVRPQFDALAKNPIELS